MLDIEARRDMYTRFPPPSSAEFALHLCRACMREIIQTSKQGMENQSIMYAGHKEVPMGTGTLCACYTEHCSFSPWRM